MCAMLSYLRLLDGIMRSRLLSIEGEGGGGDAGTGGGGGAPSGGDNSGGGGGGGTSSAAPTTPAVTAPTTSTPARSDAAPLSTQEPISTLVDESGKPQRELGEESDAFLARHRAWRNSQPKEGAEGKTPEQLAAEKTAADKVVADKLAADKAVADKKIADAAKTPEQLAAEKAAVDKKAADDKAAADKAAAEGASAFEDDSPVTTEKLAELSKDPEFQKALERSGISQDDLFATSRLADKAGKFMKILPTLEAAEHAKSQSQAFYQLEDAFTEIKAGDLPGTGKFINDVLLPMTYLRDEAGQVRKDQKTGLPMTDGTAFTFLDNIFNVHSDYLANKVLNVGGETGIGSVASIPAFAKILDNFSKVADKIGGDRGDEIKAAVDTLKGCGKAGSPSGNEDDLPENVKQELANSRKQKTENDKQKQELDARESAASEKRIADFKTGVLNESSTEIDNIIGGFLDKTSLKDDKFLRSAVVGKIREALYQNMSSDPLYLSQRDALTLSGMSKKTHDSWKSLNVREAKARLRSIADPILAEAGAKKIGRAQERQQTIQTQVDQSKAEPKGGVSTALPHVQSQDPHELIRQARENVIARGEDPIPSNIMAERRKLMAKTA